MNPTCGAGVLSALHSAWSWDGGVISELFALRGRGSNALGGIARHNGHFCCKTEVSWFFRVELEPKEQDRARQHAPTLFTRTAQKRCRASINEKLLGGTIRLVQLGLAQANFPLWKPLPRLPVPTSPQQGIPYCFLHDVAHTLEAV
jgi:hypothetical protein